MFALNGVSFSFNGLFFVLKNMFPFWRSDYVKELLARDNDFTLWEIWLGCRVQEVNFDITRDEASSILLCDGMEEMKEKLSEIKNG